MVLYATYPFGIYWFDEFYIVLFSKDEVGSGLYGKDEIERSVFVSSPMLWSIPFRLRNTLFVISTLHLEKSARRLQAREEVNQTEDLDWAMEKR